LARRHRGGIDADAKAAAKRVVVQRASRSKKKENNVFKEKKTRPAGKKKPLCNSDTLS